LPLLLATSSQIGAVNGLINLIPFENRSYLLERIQALLQVAAAGASQYIPFGNGDNCDEMFFEGRPRPGSGEYTEYCDHRRNS
jgi:hypothetical protein